MFSIEKYISFSDCDPAGIMFFSRAFEIAHTAYEKFMHANDLGDYFGKRDVIIPLVHAEADYRKPLKPGDIVVAMVKLGEIKENSFRLTYNIYTTGNEIAIKVKTVHATVLKDGFKKCPVPEDLQKALIKIEL